MTQEVGAMHTSDEARRKEIFLALVNAQDQGMDVRQSFAHVAKHFEIDEEEVRKIEREGLDQLWPPLE